MRKPASNAGGNASQKVAGEAEAAKAPQLSSTEFSASSMASMLTSDIDAAVLAARRQVKPDVGQGESEQG